MANTGDSTDLYMKFVPIGATKGILAETMTNFNPESQPGNALLDGFAAGRMFQVDRFSLNVGLEGNDSDDTQNKQNDNVKKGKDNKGKDNKGKGPQASRSTLGQFQAWRAGRLNKAYPVDINPISFTRSIDRASSILLQSCVDCKSFKSASLVKRRAGGGATAGLVYLRIDFCDVLIIEVDWSNDDEVSETCQFICRKILVRYCPQLPDGSLGAPIPGCWSVNPQDTEQRILGQV